MGQSTFFFIYIFLLCLQTDFELSEFLFFQVKVGNQTAEGMGTNKKVAKRKAAENMLELLGFKVPPAPAKPALKNDEKVSKTDAQRARII